MTNRINKRSVTIIVILIAILTLGITTAFTKNDNSETEIIGEKDVPTDIWIGEEVE